MYRTHCLILILLSIFLSTASAQLRVLGDSADFAKTYISGDDKEVTVKLGNGEKIKVFLPYGAKLFVHRTKISLTGTNGYDIYSDSGGKLISAVFTTDYERLPNGKLWWELRQYSADTRQQLLIWSDDISSDIYHMVLLAYLKEARVVDKATSKPIGRTRHGYVQYNSATGSAKLLYNPDKKHVYFTRPWNYQTHFVEMNGAGELTVAEPLEEDSKKWQNWTLVLDKDKKTYSASKTGKAYTK